MHRLFTDAQDDLPAAPDLLVRRRGAGRCGGLPAALPAPPCAPPPPSSPPQPPPPCPQGFSLSWELDYANLLELLERLGVPLRAAERGDAHPLVFGGGPVLTANPEPYADFFDVVLLGERRGERGSVLGRAGWGEWERSWEAGWGAREGRKGSRRARRGGAHPSLPPSHPTPSR